MSDFILNMGVACGPRVRNVSPKVFTAELGEPRCDNAWLQELVEEAVNAEPWSPGDVLSLRASVPDSLREQMLGWLDGMGLSHFDLADEGTMHACEGSWFHEDSFGYGENFFCVMWLEDEANWDLLFPHSDIRIPLRQGTTVLFDPAQVHGVVASGESAFDAERLGESGVQAFASLSLKMSERAMRLFETRWHEGRHSLKLGWGSVLCPTTGRIGQKL